MRAVENERHALVEGMIELHFEAFVGFFRKKRSPFCQILHFGVVVDVEVFCLEDVPFEFRVLDLIAAEVKELRVGGARKRDEKSENRNEGDVTSHRRILLHIPK
jgi:hypothetical protein